MVKRASLSHCLRGREISEYFILLFERSLCRSTECLSFPAEQSDLAVDKQSDIDTALVYGNAVDIGL